MKKITAFLTYILLWIVELLLGVWIFVQSREVFQGVLALSIQNAKNNFDALKTAHLFNVVFTIVLVIVALVFMILVEEYFRNGARDGNMVRRFLRVTGLVVLVIFGLDVGLLLLQGISAAIWERWIILVLELAAAGAMIWFGYFRAWKKPTPSPSEPMK